MEQLTKDYQNRLQAAVEGYSDMLFKIAYLRLRNMQDAEDVVQEVFYQYLKRGEGFESTEYEKAWLIRVTLNACRKVWRSAWNRRKIDVSEEQYEQFSRSGAVKGGGYAGAADSTAAVSLAGHKEPSGSFDPADSFDLMGPEERLVAEENCRLLLKAVMGLPAKYRDVIHLFYYEELSVKAIAAVTGRRESTVTSQLTRGRELLRRSLKEEYDFA